MITKTSTTAALAVPTWCRFVWLGTLFFHRSAVLLLFMLLFMLNRLNRLFRLFLRLNTHSRATSHTTSSTTRVHTHPVHPVRRRRGPPAASGTVVRALKAHACGRPAVGS